MYHNTCIFFLPYKLIYPIYCSNIPFVLHHPIAFAKPPTCPTSVRCPSSYLAPSTSLNTFDHAPITYSFWSISSPSTHPILSFPYHPVPHLIRPFIPVSSYPLSGHAPSQLCCTSHPIPACLTHYVILHPFQPILLSCLILSPLLPYCPKAPYPFPTLLPPISFWSYHPIIYSCPPHLLH